jgi:hypothetical protein
VPVAGVGDDAWINPDTQTMLQPEIKKFINVILANTWNRYRKAIRRDQKAIAGLEDQIAAGWLGKLTVSVNLLPSCIDCILQN